MSIKEARRRALFASLEAAEVPVVDAEPEVDTDAQFAAAGDEEVETTASDVDAVDGAEGDAVDTNFDDGIEAEIEAEEAAEAEVSLEAAFVKPKAADKYIERATDVVREVSNVRANNAQINLYDEERGTGGAFRGYAIRNGKLAGRMDQEVKKEATNLKSATDAINKLKAAVPVLAPLQGEELEAAAAKLKPLLEGVQNLSFLGGYQISTPESSVAKKAKVVARDDDGKKLSMGTQSQTKLNSIVFAGGLLALVPLVVTPVGAVAAASTSISYLITGATLLFQHFKNKPGPNESAGLAKAGNVSASSFVNALKDAGQAAIGTLEASGAFGRVALAAKKDSNKESWAVIKNLMEVVGLLTAPAISNIRFADSIIERVKTFSTKENIQDKEEGKSVSNESDDGSDLLPEDADARFAASDDDVEGDAGEDESVDDYVLPEGAAAADDAGEPSDAPIEEIEEVELSDVPDAADVEDQAKQADSEQREIDALNTDAKLVDDIQTSLESAIANGGLRSESANMVFMTLNGVAERAGIEFENHGVSVESFNGFSSRMVASEASLESVKDFAVKLAESIRKKIHDRVQAARDNRAGDRTLSGKLLVDIFKQRRRIESLESTEPKQVKSKELARILAPNGGEVTVDNIEKLYKSAKKVIETINKKKLENVNVSFEEAVLAKDHTARVAGAVKMLTPSASIMRSTDSGFELRELLPNGYNIKISFKNGATDTFEDLRKVLKSYREKVSLVEGQVNETFSTPTREDALRLAKIASDIDGYIKEAIIKEDKVIEALYSMDEKIDKKIVDQFGKEGDEAKQARRIAADLWYVFITQCHALETTTLVSLNRGILALLKRVK